MRYRDISEGHGEITSQIRRHAKTEAASFHVLRHQPCRPSLPLVIIIHPGDMLEDGYGYSIEDRAKVREFSQQNQLGTAKEIAEWRSLPAEVLVLNRSSCTQFTARDAAYVLPQLAAEMKTAWRSDTILFGDDLDAANAWIKANMKLEERPRIYMAGAYSDPDYGCLTYVGKAIVAAVGADKVSVSKHAHPGASPGPSWDPGAK